MYLKINKFLLAHEDLNMSKVPGFFQFFYSADFQVRLPRRSGGAGPRAACGGGGTRGASLGSLSLRLVALPSLSPPLSRGQGHARC